MIIAVDLRGTEEYRHFISETFQLITIQHPLHNFLFISDDSAEPLFIFSKNKTDIAVKQTKISLLSDLKISSLLKKYKAGVFITSRILSGTKVPQCLIAFDSIPAKSIMIARLIIADSAFSKKEITEKYKIDPDKTCIVYKGVEEICKPLLYEEKEIIKEQYSEGNEYFLVTGIFQSKNNLLDLLRAFSAFKKMQKSNMQLLILIQTEVTNLIEEALRLFKFKSDVKILPKIDKKEQIKITGAAYAFFSPVAKDGYPQILQAMKCDVPVIAGNVGAIPEVALDAALYINPDDQKDIADKMMLIYKDEKLRLELIKKGREQVREYAWENTAGSFWKCIEKACW